MTISTASGVQQSGSVVAGHAVVWIGKDLIGDGGSEPNNAFSALTSSTNTTATMVVGTGASLAATGGGTITATAVPSSGITGTLLAPQFPALTGDVTTTAGSLATTLKATGTAGTYGQVTTDAQGRVTSGTVISPVANGGTGAATLTGLVKGNGTSAMTAAVAGTDYLMPFGSQTANTFYASPNGVSGVPAFRAIVAADIPTLNQNTTGQAGTVATINSLISAGANITITGSGSVASPYSIAASGGGGSVSISNSDGTLTLSPNPITGTGTASLNLAHANTWTSPQTIASGTITTNISALSISQTWNNAAITFDAPVFVNITNTASNAASKLIDLQVGSTTQFSVSEGGGVTSLGNSSFANQAGTVSGSGVFTFNTGQLGWSSTSGSSGSPDTFITRKAAANIALGAADVASPVAQSFSVQNVVTGTSNVAGANFTHNMSQGTGTGVGGSYIVRVAPAGTTGSTQNALATALTIDSTKLATFAGSLSTLLGFSPPQALTPGTTVAWNVVAGANATLTPAQNFTLSNPTGLVAGSSGMLTVTQDATGTRVITWGSVYKFPGGTKFVLSTAASAVDQIAWYTDGTSVFCVGQAAFS